MQISPSRLVHQTNSTRDKAPLIGSLYRRRRPTPISKGCRRAPRTRLNLCAARHTPLCVCFRQKYPQEPKQNRPKNVFGGVKILMSTTINHQGSLVFGTQKIQDKKNSEEIVFDPKIQDLQEAKNIFGHQQTSPKISRSHSSIRRPFSAMTWESMRPMKPPLAPLSLAPPTRLRSPERAYKRKNPHVGRAITRANRVRL